MRNGFIFSLLKKGGREAYSHKKFFISKPWNKEFHLDLKHFNIHTRQQTKT